MHVSVCQRQRQCDVQSFTLERERERVVEVRFAIERRNFLTCRQKLKLGLFSLAKTTCLQLVSSEITKLLGLLKTCSITIAISLTLSHTYMHTSYHSKKRTHVNFLQQIVSRQVDRQVVVVVRLFFHFLNSKPAFHLSRFTNQTKGKRMEIKKSLSGCPFRDRAMPLKIAESKVALDDRRDNLSRSTFDFREARFFGRLNKKLSCFSSSSSF